jgi:hypothetical protein
MDDINMELRETEYENVDWVQLAKDRVQWLDFVKNFLNLRPL